MKFLFIWNSSYTSYRHAVCHIAHSQASWPCIHIFRAKSTNDVPWVAILQENI